MHGTAGVETLFLQALALLVAAVAFVAVAGRIGLSPILGYFAAGALIGPGLGLVDDPEALLTFSEFGVTLLLFVIGLELQPTKLWAMRKDIVALGAGQIVASGAVLGLGALLLGVSPTTAVIVGLGLALSSTALVMQLLTERRELTSPVGRTTFAVLLAQDLAIVPLLLLVSVLTPGGETTTLVERAASVGLALIAALAIIGAGRFLLNPLFSLLARAGAPEIMTAAALAVVIGAAGLMDAVGMSYGAGAFLAGVMLAESRFRHELEADIEPFRGLFLGLFFMAVGASLEPEALREAWLAILLLTPLGMAAKAAATWGVVRASRRKNHEAATIALLLCQFGEFGFVLFAAAVAGGLLSGSEAATLTGIVTLSMALAPFATRLLALAQPRQRAIDEDWSDAGGRVLIIGFGRFGQIVSQVLLAQRLSVTIIDNDAARIEEAARFGSRIFYGDGQRRDVLLAAGAAEAELICICVDDREAATRIAEMALATFPRARVLARAFDRRHAIRLIEAGIEQPVRETFGAALAFGALALEAAGLSERAVAETIEDVRDRDTQRLQIQARDGLTAGRDLLVARVRPEPLFIAPTATRCASTGKRVRTLGRRRFPKTRRRGKARVMNRHEPLGTPARLRYGDGDYQVLAPGSFVVCAVTGERIPLSALRYWSVDRQEAYRDAAAALARELSFRTNGAKPR